MPELWERFLLPLLPKSLKVPFMNNISSQASGIGDIYVAPELYQQIVLLSNNRQSPIVEFEVYKVRY